MGFPSDLGGKESTCQCRRHGFHPWVGEDPLEKGVATHSSILAWRIPQTEEPGGPQSSGLQRVRHNSARTPSKCKVLESASKHPHRLMVHGITVFRCQKGWGPLVRTILVSCVNWGLVAISGSSRAPRTQQNQQSKAVCV